MANFFCQNCGKSFDAPADLPAGATITCPNCKTAMSSIPIPIPVPAAAGKKFGLKLPPLAPPEKFTIEKVSAIGRDLIGSVEHVIFGKHDQITLAVAVLLAEGHLLVEDVPGVAKTMLARAVAQSAGCTFKRIQCTPDLQPSDVLGVPASPDQEGRVEFRFGPLFAQFVLVDEINRASPRTQAALLEAMGESSVTTGRVTYQLARPFIVIATQNPIDQEGTFLLPEAQKDRFLARLNLGYPSLADEKGMCENFQLNHPIESLKPVTAPEHILKCQERVREVRVDSAVCDYILALVRATREHPALVLGASPRGSLGLFRAAQALAAIEGSDSVSPDHVKRLAEPVLAHRLILKKDPASAQKDVREIIREIVTRESPA
jgi:MoxR-like ATPase